MTMEGQGTLISGTHIITIIITIIINNTPTRGAEGRVRDLQQ